MIRKLLAAGLLACIAAAPSSAQTAPKSISGDVVRLGVLGDMSGMLADLSGKGAVEAVKMAVEDFGGTVLGKPIDVISADHQNKPDVAAATARRWYDNDGVDVITDVVGSANSLAVAAIATERKRIALMTNGATAELNNKQCSPYAVQWRSDTFAIVRSTVKSIFEQGGDTWYIIAADYALGHSFADELTKAVEAAGGKVVRRVAHPQGTVDFSSYIVAAQSSGAKIIAFANAGADMINSFKSSAEFGLTASGKQRVTGLLVFISDIHAVGLDSVQGLIFEADYYWNMDERTREFALRFQKRTGRMPTMTHAANYSAVTTYLKAVQAAGTDDADDVMAEMRKMRIDDLFARNAHIREDGLLIHDLFLFGVKTRAESKGEWDYYQLLATIPGKEAFRPLSDSACPYVKKQ